MADLYSILAKAVDALDPNTEEARRRLYERARAALVAEARGLNQPELDFLDVLGALEEAIQQLEAQAQAKAQRERRIRHLVATTSTAPPYSIGEEASPPPRAPIARQRARGFMPFLAHAMHLGREGVRNLLRRTVQRSEYLAGDFSNEIDRNPPNDNWLSELLAKASRAEHDDSDDRPLPWHDARRNR